VFDITIPKLNTVDTTYLLVDWLFPDGATVPAEAAVAVVETSKAAEELVSDRAGVLHRLIDPPAECALGATIGYVFAGEDERRAFLAAADGPRRPGPAADLVVTRSARELISRHGVAEERLRALGKRVIKAADVERLLPPSGDPAGAERSGPTRVQRAIAEVVSRSHRTIPAAYAVIRIGTAAADDVLRRLSERERVTIGLPELLVKCLGSLQPDFPACFGEAGADGAAVPAGAAHVGVTVDVGTGLYVPIVRDAGAATLPDIARTLMAYRVDALRGAFRQADLVGGTIAVSLADDPDIVFSQPLILPPHVCMLSLGSTREELYLDPAEGVSSRPGLHLGLAYDHRVINGREAGHFLRAIKDVLESADRVAGIAESGTGG
jgi:2-oxoglutarate dehydrogenase E2 component (dihydrolipoamide succinyltransferase)